jgi:hypothetical protein
MEALGPNDSRGIATSCFFKIFFVWKYIKIIFLDFFILEINVLKLLKKH